MPWLCQVAVPNCRNFLRFLDLNIYIYIYICKFSWTIITKWIEFFFNTIISKWIKILIWLKLNYTCYIFKWIKTKIITIKGIRLSLKCDLIWRVCRDGMALLQEKDWFNKKKGQAYNVWLRLPFKKKKKKKSVAKANC